MDIRHLWPTIVIVVCMLIFIFVLAVLCRRWCKYLAETHYDEAQIRATARQTATSTDGNDNNVFSIEMNDVRVVDPKPPPYCELPPSYAEVFGVQSSTDNASNTNEQNNADAESNNTELSDDGAITSAANDTSITLSAEALNVQ